MSTEKKDTTGQGSGEIHAMTEALVNVFRDAKQKEAVISITGSDDKTLDNLIKAAAAYLIIHQFKLEYPGDNELAKSQNLYRELKSLFGDTIGDSIKIQEKAMAFYTAMFDMLLKTPAIKVPEKRRGLIDGLEGDLIEILRTFPEYYFFDFLESVIEFTSITKKLGKQVKKVAGEGVKEAFSFSLYRKAIIEFLRIHKLKDLELLYQPIKKLGKAAYDQNIENMPLSRRGMDAFFAANQFRNEIIKIFQEANSAGESLEAIAKKIHEKIIDRLRATAELSSNDVLYYLQYLLGMKFTRLVELLKSYGIQDLTLVGTALTTDYTKLEYRFSEKGIEKADIEKLLKFEGNMTAIVQVSLDDFKRDQKSRGFSKERYEKTTIQSMIQDHLSDVDNPALAFIANDMRLSKQELVDLLLLEVNVKEIIKDAGIKSMNTLLVILKLQRFIDSITEEIFISMLSKLTRQVARIMEFFLLLGKAKKDMLENIAEVRRSSRVKPRDLLRFQDGFTGLIMDLQDNVAYILNKEDPYDVNAFIHGKLCELTYEAALKEIKEGNSPVYFGVVSHPIVLDDLEVVSNISALDLFFRCQLKKAKP
nr:hypothetical protein [Candidatus Sigynarchaeota archaeon]